jgi:sugar lactone lactonase YvrE
MMNQCRVVKWIAAISTNIGRRLRTDTETETVRETTTRVRKDGQRKARNSNYDRLLAATGGVDHSGRHVAVAVSGSNRVSVFAMDGSLVRHVGAGVLKRPTGVACSAFDEIVVADAGNRCVRVFSDADELLMSFGVGGFTGVAVGGSTVFAADADAKECLVWT